MVAVQHLPRLTARHDLRWSAFGSGLGTAPGRQTIGDALTAGVHPPPGTGWPGENLREAHLLTPAARAEQVDELRDGAEALRKAADAIDAAGVPDVADGDVIARGISSTLADLAAAFEDGHDLGRSIATDTSAISGPQGVMSATKRIIAKRDQLEVAMRAALSEDGLGQAVDESTACSTRLDEYHLDKDTGNRDRISILTPADR